MTDMGTSIPSDSSCNSRGPSGQSPVHHNVRVLGTKETKGAVRVASASQLVQRLATLFCSPHPSDF
jgi:hypothetical protein